MRIWDQPVRLVQGEQGSCPQEDQRAKAGHQGQKWGSGDGLSIDDHQLAYLSLHNNPHSKAAIEELIQKLKKCMEIQKRWKYTHWRYARVSEDDAGFPGDWQGECEEASVCLLYDVRYTSGVRRHRRNVSGKTSIRNQPQCRLTGLQKAATFQHLVAKWLSLYKWARPYLRLAVGFLCRSQAGEWRLPEEVKEALSVPKNDKRPLSHSRGGQADCPNIMGRCLVRGAPKFPMPNGRAMSLRKGRCTQST